MVWLLCDRTWEAVLSTQNTPIHIMVYTIYVLIFEGLIFRGRQVFKDFCGLIFADHQVEYSVSLSHCFFFED